MNTMLVRKITFASNARRCFGLFLLVSGVLCQGAHSATLNPAHGYVSCGPYTDDQGRTFSSQYKLAAGSISEVCSWRKDDGSSGASTASLDFGNGQARASGSSASGDASITFEVTAVPNGVVPPYMPDIIPVQLAVTYAINATGLAAARVYVYGLTPSMGTFTDPDMVVLSRSKIFERQVGGLAMEGSLAHTDMIDTLLGVNMPRILQKEARCDAGLDGSCSAAIDPVVSFNQVAFDGMAGALTFPLEQYFRIEYSANFLNAAAVPELPTAWMLLVGAGLMGSGWLRRRARRAD